MLDDRRALGGGLFSFPKGNSGHSLRAVAHPASPPFWTHRPSRAIIIAASQPQTVRRHFLRRGNEYFSQRAKFAGIVSLRILRNSALDLRFIRTVVRSARRRRCFRLYTDVQAHQGPHRRAKNERHAL